GSVGFGGSVAVGGSVGFGGSVAAGGSAGSCAGVRCAPIACGPGSIPVLSPGECCPHCEPTSSCDIPCPALDCQEGYHLEVSPGQCCPTCVPNSMVSCDDGKKAYEALRAQLIEKYQSNGCKRNEDCGVMYEHNRCAATCGAALPADMIA